ncbi:MAG TPA: hypothetical protein VH083_24620, partial [Myxococcales bacterium]|nr:hypothetical protein [Myxococcales bacterium]
AIAVSAYTAYVQRQQVRAQVWPVLELSTSNEPELMVSLSNKGVGPALVRHVIITVDDKPVPNWRTALQQMLGQGNYNGSQETVSNRIVSAGERLNIFALRDSAGEPLHGRGAEGSLAARFNKERFRIGAEICYCSTLGDCWTLKSKLSQDAPRLDETRGCPSRSAATFEQ